MAQLILERTYNSEICPLPFRILGSIGVQMLDQQFGVVSVRSDARRSRVVLWAGE